jgi:MFS transporter, OFA family, oxalate/formate antiporter
MRYTKRFRWLVASMGTILQMVLGTVYAWSFFQKPIMESYAWSNVQVMWIFSIAIVFLGISAAVGGAILPKVGPKRLAVFGVILYASGYFISSFALSSGNLALFYVGFGVLGGIGLGLGYVTPVAVVSRWFPDKKGLATGMVIMGFGFGALLMSKVIAPSLILLTEGNLVMVFFYVGLILLLLGFPAALFMSNPPVGWNPDGYNFRVHPTISQVNVDGPTIKNVLLSGKYLRMWMIFFLNIAAGIIFIGWQSPMFQELYAIHNPELNDASLAAAGATLIAISSIFNGLGRLFWGAISDKIGRIQTFRFILSTQVLVFVALMFTSHPLIFMVLVCYILLCYGGGFGTMPSFVLDVFGPQLLPVVYGTILTAWSIGGIAGPQIAAYLKDNHPEIAGLLIFVVAASLLFSGLLLAMTINNKPLTVKGL